MLGNLPSTHNAPETLYRRIGKVEDVLFRTPPPEPEVRSWSVCAKEVFSSTDMRLDANAYDPVAKGALAQIEEKGLVFRPLFEFASVFYRPRFKRIWADNAGHGIPYFNTTDLLSIFALGAPSPQRFLSNATKTDIDGLIVREGWLLMACSGTVGRVFYVPQRLDRWAATHDIMRIVPNDPKIIGYLYAWLSTPLARSQLESRQYSTQVDHITEEQVASLPVPVLPETEMAKINDEIMTALVKREHAIAKLATTWPNL